MSDLRIFKGFPKNGWPQGTAYAIIEREDGYYVISHWQSMWKGGTEHHACLATEDDAVKWIENYDKQLKEKHLRQERNRDLKEIQK